MVQTAKNRSLKIHAQHIVDFYIALRIRWLTVILSLAIFVHVTVT